MVSYNKKTRKIMSKEQKIVESLEDTLDDFVNLVLDRAREGEEIFSDTPLSAFGESLQEQTDKEIQTEHWDSERLSE
jgi:hypothetical protein